MLLHGNHATKYPRTSILEIYPVTERILNARLDPPDLITSPLESRMRRCGVHAHMYVRCTHACMHAEMHGTTAREC